MEQLIELHILVPVENRPGVYAVLPELVARVIKQGYMKLYWRGGRLVRETITRTRSPIEAPLVFVAVDPDGTIITEVVP
jgi:hypothetical protein